MNQTNPAKQNTAAPVSFRDIFLLALWFALVCGVLEGVEFWLFQSLGLLSWKVKENGVDENILWASTLMDVALLAVAGVVVWAALRMVRPRAWREVATAALALPAFYALVSVSGRIRESGALVLALGLAVVAARWMGRAPERRMALMRRSLAGVAIGAVMACAGAVGGMRLLEMNRIRSLPAPPAGAPNVLFIVLDTLRADRVGTYGYSRPTSPFLDSYAKEAVVFERAVANAPWTLPSHVTFFTGRMPFEHGATQEAYDGRFPTLAQVLAARGYVTAGVAANNFLLTHAFGVPRGFLHWDNLFTSPLNAAGRTVYGRKFQKYVLARYFPDQVPRDFMTAEDVNRRFLRWLDGRPNRPFLAFLNYMEMHLPNDPPPEFARRFCKDARRVRFSFLVRQDPPNPQDLLRLSDQYDALLAYLDDQLGKLFAELARRHLDENLLVIITSDHGESIGEHFLIGHRTSLYLEQLKVPLIIRLPGKTPAGRRIAAPVELAALPATIMDLIGAGPQVFPGRSLASCWTADECGGRVLAEVDAGSFPGGDKYWPIRKGWLKSLLDRQWHFILKENGEIELFDWGQDAGERDNLASTDAGKPIAEAMHQQIEQRVPSAFAAKRAEKSQR